MPTARPLDQADLQSLLARYDIGTPQQYRPATHGIENSNYFVTTLKDGVRDEWVLTLLEQPSHSGPAYVPLLDLCHEAHLPVAPVVRNRAGDARETLLDKPAMLAPRLPGEHLTRPDINHIRTLGRFIADLHRATAEPGFSIAAYPRNERWLRDRTAAVRGRVAYTDERVVAECVERVAGLLNRRDVAEMPTGVIHGDLFRDNVLFDGRKLTGVLDFHHASRGYLIYDLAVAVNDWCSRKNGSLDARRAAAMVTAYHQVRPLTILEQCFFSGFLLYAGVAFWLSRLVVALDARSGAAGRFKNPDEFRDIVNDRSMYFFDLGFLDSAGQPG